MKNVKLTHIWWDKTLSPAARRAAYKDAGYPAIANCPAQLTETELKGLVEELRPYAVLDIYEDGDYKLYTGYTDQRDAQYTAASMLLEFPERVYLTLDNSKMTDADILSVVARELARR